jgi:hypothetical protein
MEAKPDNANMMELKSEIRVGYDYTVDYGLGKLSSPSGPSLGSELMEGAASERSDNRSVEPTWMTNGASR